MAFVPTLSQEEYLRSCLWDRLTILSVSLVLTSHSWSTSLYLVTPSDGKLTTTNQQAAAMDKAEL